VLTYGTAAEADLRAVNIRQQETRMHFTVELRGRKNWLPVSLNLPGQHNVLNALAAIGIAHELGVNEAAIARALAGFAGIGRRFQINGSVACRGGDVILVDDYAHHPREIAATVAAARASWPERRLVVVFQPHRYTRTHDLLDDFSTVLAGIDALMITEVYAAGEAPISGADGRALCRAIRARGKTDPVFVEDLSSLPRTLQDVLRANDVLLTMGAGSIGNVAASLAQDLGQGRGG
jgi:UDP-N-acetylmuramate--alanine ligase